MKVVPRQTDVSPVTLHTREDRYGVLLPDRTAGGAAGIWYTLDKRPAFAFGGPAVNHQRELVDQVPGTFLDETIQPGIKSIKRMMIDRKSNQ